MARRAINTAHQARNTRTALTPSFWDGNMCYTRDQSDRKISYVKRKKRMYIVHFIQMSDAAAQAITPGLCGRKWQHSLRLLTF